MSQIVKPVMLNETGEIANQKLQQIIDKLGNVQHINGKTGDVTITFTALTTTQISGSDGDYVLNVVPGTVSGIASGT